MYRENSCLRLLLHKTERTIGGRKRPRAHAKHVACHHRCAVDFANILAENSSRVEISAARPNTSIPDIFSQKPDTRVPDGRRHYHGFSQSSQYSEVPPTVRCRSSVRGNDQPWTERQPAALKASSCVFEQEAQGAGYRSIGPANRKINRRQGKRATRSVPRGG
jgi:hypothetical protein